MAYIHLTDEYPYNSASPTHQPGCFVCGAPKRIEGPEARHPNGELLVDLGVSTDEVQELGGEVHSFKQCVICESCVREIASLVGCATPEHASRLASENVTLTARIIELERIADDYAKMRDALGKVRV